MKNFPSSQTAEMRWNSSPVTQRPQVLHNACVKLSGIALPEKMWGEDYHQLCLPNRPQICLAFKRGIADFWGKMIERKRWHCDFYLSGLHHTSEEGCDFFSPSFVASELVHFLLLPQSQFTGPVNVRIVSSEGWYSCCGRAIL